MIQLFRFWMYVFKEMVPGLKETSALPSALQSDLH